MSADLLSSDGVVTIAAKGSTTGTVEKLKDLINARTLILFAHIDFQADAERAGLTMRAAQLIVFGNPLAGTPVMIAAPTSALDFPQKILVWENEDGATCLSYNSPDWLKRRHHLSDDLMKPFAAIRLLVEEAAA